MSMMDRLDDAEAQLSRLMEETLPPRKIDTSAIDYGFPHRSALAIIPKRGNLPAEQVWLERIDGYEGDFLINLKLAQIIERRFRKNKIRELGSVVVYMSTDDLEYNYILGETGESILAAVGELQERVLAIQRVQVS